MPVLADRVQESTTTGGTGTITLAGAVTGYRSFAQAFSIGDITYYTIDNGNGEWEIGVGTVGSGTLSRDSVLESSNSNALVNFSAGTKRVFCSAPTKVLLPNQTSNSGKVLTTNGTDPAWTTTLNGMTIGNITPGSGAFTTLSASSTVSGTGFSTYLASPPAIGGTTPAAGAFTTLSSTGNTTLGDASGDTLTINAGTTTFTGTGNRITGDFSNATIANRVMFQTSTANSTTSVGAIPSGTGTSAELRVYNNSDITNCARGMLGANSADVRLVSGIEGTGTYLPMTFYTGGSERVRIDTSGNVGIGTSSPSALLTLGSQTGGDATYPGHMQIRQATTTLQSTGGLEFRGSTFGSGYGFKWSCIDSSGVSLVLGSRENSTTWTERLRIDSSGNVGIGIAPYDTNVGLTVYRSQNSLFYQDLSNPNTGSSAGTILRLISSNVAGSGTVSADIVKYKSGAFVINNNETNSAAYTGFGVGSSERLRIASDGSCVWKPNGTTSAMTLDASGNLLVGDTGTVNAKVYTVFSASGTSSYGYASKTTGGVGSVFFNCYNSSGTAIGGISQNDATTVAFNTTSDRRLKENIVDAPSAIASVNSIKVRSFDWILDGSHVDYGYIAQELLEIAPEAVSVPTNTDEMMGVDFGKLTPRLVKAIQELHAKIESLEQRIH